MPKEVIRLGQKFFGLSQEEQVSYPFRVHVGWADGTVQLATRNTEVGDFGDPAGGWYVDLTRQDINRLIRSLRVARDRAYGGDE